MTKKAAKEFLEKIEKDAQFRSQLQKAKDEKERAKILEEHQFLFSKKEFMEAYQEKYHRTLTEQELKNIRAAGAKGAGPGQAHEIALTAAVYFHEK